jgi:putative hydrolase of the HAD superfamily
MKDLIIFIDSGDTLIDESTEIRNETGTVVHAELFENAGETLAKLYESGYTIALVADGLKASFDNVYSENGLSYCFAVRAISGEIGHEKPSEVMFYHAMKELGLGDSDKSRIVMVGNNLKRDIAGANRVGLTSILVSCSPRYDMRPTSEDETPDYVIADPGELFDLIEQLDLQVKNRRVLSRPVSETAIFKS